MKRLLILLALSAAVLCARPSSGSHSSSHSSGSHSSSSHSSSSSYGSSHSYSQSARPSARPQARPPTTSSTYTKSNQSNWGSSKAVLIQRTNVEQSTNRVINQTVPSGGVSRSQAVRDQRAATVRPARTYDAPRGYNSTVSYSTARGYRHYYDYEPSYWPGSLPHSYLYNGLMYSLLWNSMYHSYGWYGPGNQWVYYDSVASNAAVSNAYAAGEQAGAAQVAMDDTQQAPAPVRTVVVRQGTSVFVIMFWTFLIIGLLGGLGFTIYYLAIRETAPTPMTPRIIPSAQRTSYRAPTPPAPTAAKGTLEALVPGGSVYLTDAISVQDAKTLSADADGLFVKVDSILRVQEKDGLISWTFLYGTSEFESQCVLIKVKDTRGNRSAVCYTPDVEGTRSTLVDQGDTFLFIGPTPDPMDMRYAQSFSRQLGDTEETFGLIHSQELHGTALYTGRAQELLATVAEYRNAARSGNEYLALELGTDEASNVEGWWGDSLEVNQIEFVDKRT